MAVRHRGDRLDTRLLRQRLPDVSGPLRPQHVLERCRIDGLARGFGGERRCVRGEAGLQRVGRLVKNLCERFQGKVARIYAVVPAQDLFKDGLRSGFEL